MLNLSRLVQQNPLLLGVAIYYLLAIVLINPSGEMPLYDEWAYVPPVKTFLQTGIYHFYGLPSCYLLIVIGAAISKIFGFSLLALRSINLVLGLLSAAALYFCFLEIGIRRKLAAFLTGIYIANPIFLNLCFCFMTDVPALCFTNFYFLFVLKAIKGNSRRYLWLAMLMMICSLLVRQTAELFIVANVFLCWLIPGKNNRFNLSVLLALVLLPIAVAAAESQLAVINTDAHLDEINKALKAKHVEILQNLFIQPLMTITHLIDSVGEIACYMGIFCSALLISMQQNWKQYGQKEKRAWFCSIAAAIFILFVTFMLQFARQRFMPFCNEIWNFPYVGMKLMVGGYAEAHSHLLDLLRLALTSCAAYFAPLLICILSVAGIAVFTLYKKHSQSVRIRQYAFCYLSGASALAIVLAMIMVRDWDRYYLTALPPILICLAFGGRLLKIKWQLKIGTVLLLLMAIYSLFAAQDYMSWNRGKQKAMEKLLERGVAEYSIDAGLEYSLYEHPWLYGCAYADRGLHFASAYCGSEETAKLRYWPIVQEKYILSTMPVPGYEVADQQDYWSLLLMKNKQILVLRQVKR